MLSRRAGRILAVQSLYAWDLSHCSPEQAVDFSWSEEEIEQSAANFSRLLVRGTIENAKAVDTMIRSHLKHWSFSRIRRVDLAILRLSTFSLMFQPDISPSVVISEAISIADILGTDDSFRFVNGILDSIRKTR